MPENFNDLIIDDKITCKQLRMQDIIDNKLPIAVENLDFSHMIFEDGTLPDLSFIEVREHFDCSHTNLISFEGFPDVTGSFDISNTSIMALNKCPVNVKEIEISYTEISSFKGCPEGLLSIDAWKTEVSSFDGLPNSIKKLSIGRTKIRDISKCPITIEDLTIDYLNISSLKGLPSNLKNISIAGALIEDFAGMPASVEEITCYHSDTLKGINGLNIEVLKGIAIIGCPNILDEEIDAYQELIKVRTLLEKQEILEAFTKQKATIIRQREIDAERRMYK